MKIKYNAKKDKVSVSFKVEEAIQIGDLSISALGSTTPLSKEKLEDLVKNAEKHSEKTKQVANDSLQFLVEKHFNDEFKDVQLIRLKHSNVFKLNKSSLNKPQTAAIVKIANDLKLEIYLRSTTQGNIIVEFKP